MEYGLTIGIVALLTATMLVRSSAGVSGVWQRATSTAMKSEAARMVTTSTAGCLGEAHGDSKICATNFR